MSPRDSLDAETRAALDRDGFALLHDVVGPADLRAIRARVEAAAEQGEHADPDLLVDERIERAWTHPRVQAAAGHILGDGFSLTQVSYRCPRPGHGAQLLHCDWGFPVARGQYFVCNAFLALCDFTEENGATRVVPGTHVYGRLPPVKPLAWRHPQERRLLGPAGTVFVFNGHVWHSGMPNRSRAPRPALVMSYGIAGALTRAVPPSMKLPR
jgi:Phytanoyl-CoA dioxygenase (PhyH)